MSTHATPAPVRLGAGGPLVGPQGFGCMGISAAYGETTDPAEARATLERALELGVTLFDTADFYGDGDNEEFLAPFFAAHREEVTLATKFALHTDPRHPGLRLIRNDRAYLRAAVEASLRRLGVETLDLYYMHRRDPGVPLEESVGAMAELVQEGKVRHLGLSEVTAEELRAAAAVHPIAALQSEWSLFSRHVEESVVPTAAELGVALVPFSPLGRGFLTGSFADADKELSSGDFRRQLPRFHGENAVRNAELVDTVREVGRAHGASSGQVALAWLHRQAEVHGLPVVPIPGTRRRARVEENLGALALALTAEETARLEALAAEVQGTPYGELAFTPASTL